MTAVDALIQTTPLAAWLILIASFAILAKSADLFVDSAVGLACRFHIPKLVIGIVLVSLATTAPELTVSMMAAIRGQPEMALGNAIGSVICDDGLALGLGAMLASAPIMVLPEVLKTSGLFLIFVEGLLALFIVFDASLTRGEGIILLLLFFFYMGFMYRRYRRRGLSPPTDELEKVEAAPEKTFGFILLLFGAGLAGILVTSRFIIISATSIAKWFGIPEAAIALTLVAFGTSIPEVATAIVAGRKGHGDIAVGNIIGADIMNICWVAGASSIANDLVISKNELAFMLPSMVIIVGVMLGMIRAGYTMTRKKGLALLGLYLIYLLTFVIRY